MFLTAHFDVHGHGLTVHAPSDLLEIVGRRLAPFRVDTLPAGDAMRIDYVLGREPFDPSGCREVCSTDPHPALGGEIARYWYHPISDLLAVAVGARRCLLVDAAAGRARIDLPVDYLASVRVYTHMLVTVALAEMLRRRGIVPIHAAGVEVAPGVGALIYGASGSGKTTLAVSLLSAGLPFQGDDITLLRAGPDGVEALAFPDEIDLTDASRERIPNLRADAMVRYTGGAKWAARPEALTDVTPATRLVPRMLLLPRVAHAPTTELDALGAGDALVELVPTLLPTHPDVQREGMAVLARLVQQCRCLRMRTGTDLFDLRTVPRLLRDAAGAGRVEAPGRLPSSSRAGGAPA